MKSHLFGGQPVVGQLARGRHAVSRVLRPLAFLEIGMRRVGKVIELLRLPGQQAFGQVADRLPFARRGDLFRKCGRVTREVKCLGGDHARRLVIVVILTRDIRG